MDIYERTTWTNPSKQTDPSFDLLLNRKRRPIQKMMILIHSHSCLLLPLRPACPSDPGDVCSDEDEERSSKTGGTKVNCHFSNLGRRSRRKLFFSLRDTNTRRDLLLYVRCKLVVACWRSSSSLGWGLFEWSLLLCFFIISILFFFPLSVCLYVVLCFLTWSLSVCPSVYTTTILFRFLLWPSKKKS